MPTKNKKTSSRGQGFFIISNEIELNQRIQFCCQLIFRNCSNRFICDLTSFYEKYSWNITDSELSCNTRIQVNIYFTDHCSTFVFTSHFFDNWSQHSTWSTP